MKNNSQIKKIGKGISVIIMVTVIAVCVFKFPQYSAQCNLMVLASTFLVLVLYTYDTHRIANQTVEANLRPVILRSGWISCWEDIKFSFNDEKLEGTPLQFTILKNIATDISGYIVINGGKYKLLFANEISQIMDNGKFKSFQFLPIWGWMKAGTVIYSIYDVLKFDVTQEENSINLFYKDIEGNEYFTKENNNFSQSSGIL